MNRMLFSAALAFTLVPGFAALANDRDDGRASAPTVFVKIDGIDGESTVKGHEGEIEAFNFSETFRQSTDIGSATGGSAAGKFTPGPVVFSKVHGKATIGLIRACANGAHFKDAIITFRKTGGKGTPVEYYKITLQQVFVTGINEKSNGDSLVDEVQLVFASARWEELDPADATDWDSRTGKASSTAPTTGRTTR